MTFTTLTFVIFLAIVFVAYWSVRVRTAQNVLLLVASYFFYAWWDYRFCSLMLASSLLDYYVGLGLDRARGARARRVLLWVSLAGNLGMLGFFKYFNFFSDGLRRLCGSLGWAVDDVTLSVVLPVGISFYTFQTLSYSIDIYRGKIRASRQLIEYLAFVSFFPQLVAGPIERAADLLPKFERSRRFDPVAAADGCRQALWGFFKKMVVADRLALVVNDVYGVGGVGGFGGHGGPAIAFASLAFAFQIYCDFSAYSDIAIGTARLFGFGLRRNFAYPFFGQSLGELWRRWHISMTTWFRDYVFLPLGGARGGGSAAVRNIMITYLLIGLWHGASWTFVCWGGFMGLCFVPEALGARWGWGGGRRRQAADDGASGICGLPSAPVAARMLMTVGLFSFSALFFRAPDIGASMEGISRVVGDALSPGAYVGVVGLLGEDAGRNAALVMLFVVAIEWAQRRHPHPLVIGSWPRWCRWMVYGSLLWACLMMAPSEREPFIYFNF